MIHLGEVWHDEYEVIEEVTFTPDGSLIGTGGGDLNCLFEIDQITGEASNYFPCDPNQYPQFHGLVCVAEGIFYTVVEEVWPNPYLSLWRINTNDGTVTYIGETGHGLYSDMTLYNGEVYYYSRESDGIIQVDLESPSNSTLVVNTPVMFDILGLTASPFCHTLLAVTRIGGTDDYSISTISLIDGSVTKICDIDPYGYGLTSMLEFSDLSDCDIALDLDCNDSSGATEADYNSTEISCTMRQAAVADEDVRMYYDDFIAEMTIRVTGFIPDGSNEVIDITGSVSGIDVSGQGTDVLTLSNAGGARSTDFIDALHLVRYINTAFNPTAGLRTIEVQFTTESGSQSNIATAFIQVIELPPLDVDIGPDQIICEGDVATFDAGSFPGATYQWSSGPMTQSITTATNGQYIVTVMDDTHCPGTDTALLTTIPVITVALTGDSIICDDQSATLTLNTNATFPITVEIQTDPGSPFVFDDVTGDYSFIDLPQNATTYTITSVVPSQEACITITDPIQVVEVFPTYAHVFDVSICDGDSVWLGFFWETQPGVYENTFNTIDGCDSIVTTNLSILPSVQIAFDTTTCHASEAGVFITHLDNPNGCDTVVTTTVNLLPLDTTYLMATSCRIDEAGINTLIEAGSDGCDSIIITTTDYIPPVDTTFIFEESCDSSLLGVTNEITSGLDGCDSLIITTVTFGEADTTYLFATTCDSTQLGIIHDTAVTINGCDSLIITTTTFSLSDTTYLFATSCDPSDTGVLVDTLTGSDGCDSLVITTISFAEQDSVFLTGTTCDPMQAGVTTEALINQFGCDSIVTTTISLFPSDTTYLTDASCIAVDTGIWIVHLVNQNGCDSMVVTTVALLPSDQTFINETTCDPAQAGMFITTHFNQYGCDSIVTRTVELLQADTTRLFFETCEPNEVGTTTFTETGSDGCDSIIVETTTLYPLPILIVQSAIDYNGFDISCTDESDGSAIAIITGTAPYSYLWSTTETDQQISGLSAGDYAVTITDGNGCTATEVITLAQPDALMMSLEVTEPDCFDQAFGAITVHASGGVPPYKYAIDGGLYQDESLFSALGDGIYQLTVMDANECTASEIIAIDVPLTVQVDLGDNQTILLGDSALLEAIINLPFDSIANLAWTGLDTGACANCLTQIVAPVITTAYSVSLTSVDGCSDRDSVTVAVTREQQLYIPNIFSPNGDGINDVLRIGADAGVREISVMEIYDRWGNLVFGFEHKAPDDPTAYWDGRFNGQALNPGVYAYRVVIAYTSGETEVRYGDVTLVR